MKTKSVLVMCAALMLWLQPAPPVVCAAEADATPARTPVPDVGSGRVAWFDVATSNLGQAKDFYSKLFEWKYAPVEGTDQAVEIVSNGQSIGTLRVADGKVSPFNGVVYVQVTDIEASCKKGKELGGTISEGFPFNLPNNRGAIAVVVDPTGHPVGLYSKNPASTPTAPSVTK